MSPDLLAVLQAMHGKASNLSTALKGIFGGGTALQAAEKGE